MRHKNRSAEFFGLKSSISKIWNFQNLPNTTRSSCSSSVWNAPTFCRSSESEPLQSTVSSGMFRIPRFFGLFQGDPGKLRNKKSIFQTPACLRRENA